VRTQGYIENGTAAVQGRFAHFDIPSGVFAFTGRSHGLSSDIERGSATDSTAPYSRRPSRRAMRIATAWFHRASLPPSRSSPRVASGHT